MVDANPSGSPLEAVAERVGEDTVEAFELLGNETRLAILLALWEAMKPGPSPSKPPLPFSELRDRVGIRHGQNFAYHLDRLVGQFVRKTGDGYALTTAAEEVLGAALAGVLTDHPSFEGEPIDAECPHCGEPMVLDDEDGILAQCCPSCEGVPDDGTSWGTEDYLTPTSVRPSSETSSAMYRTTRRRVPTSALRVTDTDPGATWADSPRASVELDSAVRMDRTYSETNF
ncbi:hypothetical protein BRD00_13430 [Halobacteriales archaeon QS_8_69_26]|nr:MAG: hypothetical protein BRD00_13430 [Halobacteriales archaeon QS_8_69_26]